MYGGGVCILKENKGASISLPGQLAAMRSIQAPGRTQSMQDPILLQCSGSVDQWRQVSLLPSSENRMYRDDLGSYNSQGIPASNLIPDSVKHFHRSQSPSNHNCKKLPQSFGAHGPQYMCSLACQISSQKLAVLVKICGLLGSILIGHADLSTCRRYSPPWTGGCIQPTCVWEFPSFLFDTQLTVVTGSSSVVSGVHLGSLQTRSVISTRCRFPHKRGICGYSFGLSGCSPSH